jgi:hypothetical protein
MNNWKMEGLVCSLKLNFQELKANWKLLVEVNAERSRSMFGDVVNVANVWKCLEC